MRNLALIAIVLCAACGGASPGDDTPPGDDGGDDTPPTPTALARCADPTAPVAMAWEVDNIRAPLFAQAQIGPTILVTSEDGAVKTWELPASGDTPSAPGYGTPFVDEGVVVGAVGATPRGAATEAFVGLDAFGQAPLWSPSGALLGDPITLLVDQLGTFVATDDMVRWIAAGSEQGTPLAIADVETRDVALPVTEMWAVTDAAFAGDRLVTVGHWYGTPAIELRDPADPDTVLAYWDGGHADPMRSGWLRAVAVDPDGTTAIAVGDGLYLRFDLANLAAGPVAAAETPDRHDHVLWSHADDVVLALGPDAAGSGATLTVFSIEDDAVARTAAIGPAIGLTADPDTGVVITASADGMVRGSRCGD